MNDDKSKANNKTSTQDEEAQKLPVHNPLNTEDDKEITDEDVENEQMFKEAQTERD